MQAHALSIDVRSFIDENIRSAEELEILLYLRSHAHKDWDGIGIAKEFNLKPIAVSNTLMKLHLQGLIGHQECTGRYYHYRYSTHPRLKEKRISELAEAFEKAKTEVLDYIFMKQKSNLGAFSDAFKLRKD